MTRCALLQDKIDAITELQQFWLGFQKEQKVERLQKVKESYINKQRKMSIEDASKAPGIFQD